MFKLIWERVDHHRIWTALSIIQCKMPWNKIACNSKSLQGWLDSEISIKDHELVYLLRSFEMNQQQTCKDKVYALDDKGMLIYNPLSLSLSHIILMKIKLSDYLFNSTFPLKLPSNQVVTGNHGSSPLLNDSLLWAHISAII